jgi:prepilin-type processing-associated H-X9-DG protein
VLPILLDPTSEEGVGDVLLSADLAGFLVTGLELQDDALLELRGELPCSHGECSFHLRASPLRSQIPRLSSQQNRTLTVPQYGCTTVFYKEGEQYCGYFWAHCHQWDCTSPTDLHNEGLNCGFFDGHAKWVKRSVLIGDETGFFEL